MPHDPTAVLDRPAPADVADPTGRHGAEVAPEDDAVATGELARSQLRGTAVLTVTMLVVSASNYLLNLALARLLPPSEFGDANLAVNLVLAAAAVAATLQLVAARAVAADPDAAARTRRSLLRWAWAVGCAVAVVLSAGSAWLADALHTSSPWIFVLIGIGLPVYFAQAVLRGGLQGDLRIGRLAATYAVEAAARVGLALALLALGFGVAGAAAAISLSFVASGLVALHRRPGATAPTAAPAPPPPESGSPGRSLAAVSAAATVLLVGQVVIANGDVILAKFALPATEAGAYAAAALIGRALFFLSWSVVHATFPIVARAGDDAEARRRALRRALALIVGASVAGVLGLAMLGGRLAPVLLGHGYRGAVDVLVPYAIATSLFAVANAVASVDLAAGRWTGPLALLLGAGLQTVLLLTAGTTPMAMAWAQVVAMTATFLLVGAAHLAAERSSPRAATPRFATA